jgi:alanine racemase
MEKGEPGTWQVWFSLFGCIIIYYRWETKMKQYKRAAAYVDLDAITYNLASMKANLTEETLITAVIKTDGYGHGAVPIAKTIEGEAFIWGFATATIEEALELRTSGIKKPILILGYTFPETCEEIVEYDIRPAVFRMDMAQALSREAVRQNRTVHVHIKLDTGMSRIGMADNQESVRKLQEIQKLPGIELEGLFTHFAKSDEADKASARKQLQRYHSFAEECRKAGVTFSVYHCSNSAGIIDLKEANLNMVRAGITLYGHYPSEEVEKSRVPLKPAMELKSHIVHIKEIAPGTEVSYGGTYTADSTRRIATVPVGYGDGYPRSLSNRGFVLIQGKRAPIRGRVCMDQFMVDVTDIPEARPGMEVTLFGEDHGKYLELEELCGLSGRFNYEFLCDLSKRVPRIYRKDGNLYTAEDFGNTSDK